jgi:hypothetical protein
LTSPKAYYWINISGYKTPIPHNLLES